MSEFYSSIDDLLKSDLRCILIQVVKTKGSAPRDSGAFMLVNKLNSFGTIGGGCLEYQAVKKARKFIEEIEFTKSRFSYKLGPVFGQCCGGAVELSFEKLTSKLRNKFQNYEQKNGGILGNILICGAGHVGQALIRQLKPIPVNASIVDPRPQKTLDFLLPTGCKTTVFPEMEIRKAQPGTAFVILTHDHALDFLLVKEALIRNDAAYVGMIGSKTKKAALKNWLDKEDVFNFKKVFTPLGCSIAPVKGLDKRPEVIASFIIAEILLTLQLHKNSCLNEMNNAGLEP